LKLDKRKTNNKIKNGCFAKESNHVHIRSFYQIFGWFLLMIFNYKSMQNA